MEQNRALNNRKMKTLPLSERPYERCVEYGAHTLTDAQLLAVILKSGTKDMSAIQIAEQLLNHNNLNAGIAGLYQMQLPDFMKYPGIGEVKAITLLCVLELAKRLAKNQQKKKVHFQDSEAVAHYYMESMRHYHQEHFLLLLLDGKNRLIKELEMTIGTVNASLVSVRDVMIEALRYEAVYMIVLHNHPSGDSTPSVADINITKRLAEAGRLMDIMLLDHIIIGDGMHTSLRSIIEF